MKGEWIAVAVVVALVGIFLIAYFKKRGQVNINEKTSISTDTHLGTPILNGSWNTIC